MTTYSQNNLSKEKRLNPKNAEKVSWKYGISIHMICEPHPWLSYICVCTLQWIHELVILCICPPQKLRGLPDQQLARMPWTLLATEHTPHPIDSCEIKQDLSKNLPNDIGEINADSESMSKQSHRYPPTIFPIPKSRNTISRIAK